jgi:uncharacterized RDD family membrane protein YckC
MKDSLSMPPKKIPTKPPPVVPPTSEPKLSVSFFGFKVDGSGAAGVTFAFTIVLVLCGLAVMNAVLGLVAH